MEFGKKIKGYFLLREMGYRIAGNFHWCKILQNAVFILEEIFAAFIFA